MSAAWESHQEIVPVNPAGIQSVCAAAGRDGWELCAMLPIMVQPIQKLLGVNGANGLGTQTAVLLQFKRPVGWVSAEAAEDADAATELEPAGA